MSESLANSHIVVIGASGALGAECVRQLRTRGAKVSLLARNLEGLDPEFDGLERAHVDIGDRDDLARALGEVRAEGIDGIVNAAGVVAFGGIHEVPDAVVDEMFKVNARGTINVVSCGAELVQEGGFIASFSGVAAEMTVMNMSAYCASKSAAHVAMAVGARELRSKKITVLDIRAPHTETGLVERALWGTAPKMPLGLSPTVVIARVMQALETGERDLPAEAFAP
jgi:cyclic-di-GMP-binding biofilm dispersal mediator protein